MAGETKIGLLAGMAFIICFAIILANRGKQHGPASARSPYRVDAGVDLQPGPEVRSLPPARVQPLSSLGGDRPAAAPARSSATFSTRRPAPTRVDRSTADVAPTAAPASGSAVTLGRRARVMSNAGALRQHTRPARERQAPPAPDRSPGSDSPPSGFAGSTTANRAPIVPAPVPKPAPPGGLPRYTVVAGDTLSKIAAAHYNSKSPTVIAAIFEANRSMLSSPDLLSVGVELSLPVVDGFSLASTGDSSAQTQSDERVRRSAVRWYQIKKNDRYASIAREQLGDASRWREIYELNRDKFPDPDFIRDGVRIRLPEPSAGRTPQSAGAGAAPRGVRP